MMFISPSCLVINCVCEPAGNVFNLYASLVKLSLVVKLLPCNMLYHNAMLTLRNDSHWLNIPFENSEMKKSLNDKYDDNNDPKSQLWVVWETAVQPLTDVQRLIFLAFTILVVVVSIVGNVLVLYVNFSRFVVKIGRTFMKCFD